MANRWPNKQLHKSVPLETFLEVKRFTLRNYELPYCGFGYWSKRRRFLTLEPCLTGSVALNFK